VRSSMQQGGDADFTPVFTLHDCCMLCASLEIDPPPHTHTCRARATAGGKLVLHRRWALKGAGRGESFAVVTCGNAAATATAAAVHRVARSEGS
jgi:hypothetical protein